MGSHGYGDRGGAQAYAKLPEYPQLNNEARYKHLNSTRGRLDQFVGGHFAEVNLSALHFHARLDDEKHVKLEVWSAPGLTKPTFEEAKRAQYKPAKKGESFGPSWTNHWFKVTIHIPKEFEKYERVQFEFDCSGEAMVWDTKGNPYHGLTGGFGVDRRVEFIIPEEHRKAGVGHYYVEASCNGMFGQNGENPPDPNRYYRLNSADLVVPNQDAWRLMYDHDALRQVFQQLPGDSSLGNRAKWSANEIMNVFRQGDLTSVPEARKAAEKVFGADWEKEIQKESESAEKQQGTLWGIGHCHIDTAWLWPFSVTQQKSARSWSTQCDLIDRYPEHRFSATQAQQFKWTEQLYPSLFERIRTKVSEGTFQPLGCTWVEMDTNMPSGEALTRQFLYGQRFYESRFGFRSKTFVLPDTFGYASQLPQISRLSGASNFFTQKLSWNADNAFPHTTFNWVGLDGSQVLTHMTPVNNYNSQCNIDDIRRGTTNNKNLEVTSHALLLFGNGDGGGGPTPPMLEKLRRARALGKQHDAGGQLPLVKMGGSFEEFYDAVRKETNNGNLLPIWRGELYFELHRATYTSHGSIKKGNRKSEILLREAEYAATLASIYDPKYKFPKDRIDAAWEDVLLCQFHDVLPGSSIAMVYVDAEAKYAKIQKEITKVINEAYEVLYKGTRPLEPNETVPGKASLVAINTIPGYPRQEVVKVPLSAHSSVRAHSAQVSKDGHGYVLVESTADSAMCVPKGLYADIKPVSVKKLGSDSFTISNASLTIKIADGRITSIVDTAAEKELLFEGQTAGFVIFEDHPNYWDAWDVDAFHLEKPHHLKFSSVSIKENGPLRGSVFATVKYGKSTIEVEISLDAVPASLKADARSLIRFDAKADWHEKHMFLKFELPLDIHSDVATYDTQFGSLTRPTHRNTSWDAAKFEVCGHKFADLSEYGYGVALINDCKYGYGTEGSVVRLSLLRGPTMPDPETDMGHHTFSFAIYPHLGTYTESDVTAVAIAFNAPPRVRLGTATSAVAAVSPPFSVTGAPNVFLETVKRGEDDVHSAGKEQTVILRLWEQFGGHAKAKLNISGLSVAKAEIVNILEDHVSDASISVNAAEDKTSIVIPFRGFEIKTVRLTLAPGATVKTRRSPSEGWIKL
ncbi:Alpha-mannosidase [Vanrija pseudolonga]|uniref:Alpha-mannosidase n=1 Tax=Vanrija pseudolonga TaxID=143232 RepID=A0AAF0Y4B5_9TREE|nr:Alpha-mannosidase [Vanrija pseudolonga]